jgi:hypothetical protein
MPSQIPGDIELFCEELLDVLERFDASIPPFGLYASNECSPTGKARNLEWYQALKPHFEKMKTRPWTSYTFPANEAHIRHLDGSISLLRLVKVSGVKVRKFGSHYRLDKSEDFRQRWEEQKLDKRVSALWSPSTQSLHLVTMNMLLFIGFDKAQMPFEREIKDLQAQVDWEPHGVTFRTRIWPDRYDRNFHVRLAIWARRTQL